MQEFFGKMRKLLGHFGAFLVLGIFSTFTYLLYFQDKKWFWSVPLNFVQGFALASLTEWIQTFTPGRWGCWEDVLLDTSGFMCSALILTILVLLIYLLKKQISKRKLKKK
jgi:VanZ family protein